MRGLYLGSAALVASLASCSGSIGSLDQQGNQSGHTSGAGGSASGIKATDPGRVTMHRLNRVEYNATIRDLLGSSSHPADDFPPDDRGDGFDNIADILTLSPLHLSVYQTAAAQLVDEAMTNPTERALVVTCDLATGADTCAKSGLHSCLCEGDPHQDLRFTLDHADHGRSHWRQAGRQHRPPRRSLTD